MTKTTYFTQNIVIGKFYDIIMIQCNCCQVIFIEHSYLRRHYIMVYIDDNTKEKLQKLKSDSIYFLVNFDNVITDNNSSDTINIITDSIGSNKKYLKKEEELKCKYKTVELDNNLELDTKCNFIGDIWKENISLLKEFSIDDKKIKRIVNNKSIVRIRPGVKKFLKMTYEKNIPVIILSDGISEVIKYFLVYNKCYYNNITVISNSICSDDENIIIHPLNKNELLVPADVKNKIEKRKISILLASSINDINMLSKEKLKDSIKIAFLDNHINENFDIFLNYFNIIYTHNTPLDRITNKLKQM